MDFDGNLVAKFVDIQGHIDAFEKQGIFDSLCVLEEEMETITKQKKEADINLKVLKEKTKKEHQDLENVKGQNVQRFFKDQQSRNRAISKEEQEYLQALNEEEIAEANMRSVSEQYDLAMAKLQSFKDANAKAIQLNLELATILSKTFEVENGSVLENQLEADSKRLGEEKKTLHTALRKWSNARFLLVYAYNQVQACDLRWADLMKLDPSDNSKVLLATEVRNNLIAANQNMVNIKSHLKNVNIPYLSEDDFKAISGLASGIFNDMNTLDRQKYVMNIIQTIRKRCAALYQWMEQVIKDSLMADYSKIRIEFEQTTKKLKMERIKLMQEKIKEKTGKSINIKIHDTERDATKLDFNPIPNQPMPINGGDMSTPTVAFEIDEKPISIGDLPPPPSKDEILGNIERIKQQYWNQVDEWNKTLDSAKREADEKLQKILAQHKTPKSE